ncbi:CopG family transcriptional regulator [Halocatena pleomorpha]|uniref:CopG family transcriptional regulator n=1 Tax=Halocatena pleomorpha TaxID=1785090 RepID=A0A3P3RI79_9EURY|nr:CopG family transcriptional regulator [Halocatena pleomorpha]RRJ33112.1 CopG family transcriptional regulator [Halocatena pleomorpha]
MSTKKVNFRLPEELITHADVASEITHKNRTELLIEALREYIADIESDEEFRESVVELYLTDEIDVETLELIIGRQDAKAVQSSKRLLDRSDELADTLGEQ